MSSFFSRKILKQSKRVCSRLKELREKSGVDLDVLSKNTKISKKYLKALEECRLADLPEAVVYQRSFVRRYLEALSVDPEPFLQDYLIEESGFRKMKHPYILRQNWLSNLPMVFRYGLIMLFAGVLIFYLGWQVKRILEPPVLIVYSPPEGYITANNLLLVQGETGKEIRVFINGKEVSNNLEGVFKETIDLNQGVNTLNISAQKKHGKVTTEVRHVILK